MRRASTLALLCASCSLLAKETAKPVDPPPPVPAAQPALPPPDPDAGLKQEVAQVREQVRALLKEQQELYWKTWTLGEAGDLSATYASASSSWLFTPENVAKVELLRERTSDPLQARALQLLKLYLASEVLARRAAQPSDAFASALATATVSVDGQELPYRDLDAMLASEGHAGRRRKLTKAGQLAAKRLASLQQERDKRLSEAAQALGYSGYVAFAADLRQADLEALAPMAEAILAQTEAAYRAALEEVARREAGLPLAELRRADLPRLFRTGEVDTFFPKEKLIERLTSSLAAMGFDLAKLANLKVDAEPRARKNPRSLAFPVDPPADVRFSLKPAEGLGAFAQALHEAGHALLASLSPEGPFELSQLGESAVGEAAGALFEGLLDHKEFAVQAGVPASRAAGYQRFSQLRRLFSLRRAAGRLLLERAFWSSAAGDRGELCRQILGRAYGVTFEADDSDRCLLEREELFRSADRLRALVLAAQLDRELRQRVSPQWWTDPRSAELIKQIFGQQAPPAQTWLASLGQLGLDAAALLGGAEPAAGQPKP